MFLNFLMVALGGAIGASLRFAAGLAMNNALNSFPSVASFPLSTVFVNFFGCFAIGFLSHFFHQNVSNTKTHWSLFATTGILGGFTTFSTFSLEAFELFKSSDALLSAFYVVITLLLCGLGVVSGRLLAQAIWPA